MPWKRKHRERKSPRLKGWDYRTPAWYFVTMVTKNRQHFLGEIRAGIMGLTEVGCIAYQNWAAITDHFSHVALDEFIIMPNHVHGLVGIMDWPVKENKPLSGREISRPEQNADQSIGNKFGPLKVGSISSILQSYKASVTRAARKKGDYEFSWQPRFHDHIVRNDKSFDRIRAYIHTNPLSWSGDQFQQRQL